MCNTILRGLPQYNIPVHVARETAFLKQTKVHCFEVRFQVNAALHKEYRQFSDRSGKILTYMITNYIKVLSSFPTTPSLSQSRVPSIEKQKWG